LINGFLQRCEDVRKYALGAINMVGKDEDTSPFKLNGAWLFRGPDIPKEMKDCPDSDYYTWTRLDSLKEADRKRFENLFIGKTIGSDQVLERKYFK